MEKLSNDGKNISASGIIFGSLIAQRGPRGEQGVQGVQGDKPVKGIDYFTEEDKEELVQETSVIVNERFTPEYEQMQKEIEYAIGNINDMTESYNNNASEKTAEFNTNAENKINEYNANAENLINKTDELKLENTRLRNQIPTGSAEGESITLNDSSNLQYKKFNICGKSVQEGTPTPEAPIEIQSVGDDVNILENKQTTQTINGVEFTINKDKSITIKGTATANILFYLNNSELFTENIEKGSYALGGCDKGSSSTYYLCLELETADNGQKYINLTESNDGSKGYIQVNISAQNKYRSYIYVRSGAVVDTTIYPKLQKGTVATAYSEYGKGTVEIKQSGKNILTNTWEYISETQYSKIFGEFKTLVANVTTTYIYGGSSDYIGQILPAGTYTFSFNGSNFTGVYMQYLDSNGKSHNWNNGESITITDSITLVAIRCNSIALPIGTHYWDAQIEEGTEVTEYELHKSNNYVIPLSQPLRSLPSGVCDTIEEDGIHRRVGSIILDGSETGWAIYENGGKYQNSLSISNHKYSQATITAISNCFKGGTSISRWDAENDNTVYTISSGLAFRCDKYTTIDNWKAWLQENPVTVDYELAEEVIEPFDEIYNTGTFKGVTNISSSSEVTPEFDIEYYKDLEILFNNLSQAIIGGN